MRFGDLTYKEIRDRAGHDLQAAVERFNDTFDGQSTAFLPPHPYETTSGVASATLASIAQGHADTTVAQDRLHFLSHPEDPGAR